MASEQGVYDQSYIDSLKKDRKELIQKKSDISNMITSLIENIKKAYEACPKKESGSSENLAQRIEELENQIEYTSMTVKQEREQNRKIAELKKQLANVSVYENAQKEIAAMKKKREEANKERDELNAKINEISETILFSEGILRIKEITNRQMKKEQLVRSHIAIPSDKIARLCGKSFANLHKYEEDFKVFIQQDREGWILLGEKGNVEKCEASIQDALDEVEETIQFDKMIIFALVSHDSHYRRMIESDCHVKTRLVNDDSLCLIGGKNSVKQAERAIRDLFKKTSEMKITDFTRNLLVVNGMAFFKQLQEQCACYISLNKEVIVFYGKMEDQRKAMATVKEFIDTHGEVKEEVKCTSLFFNFLQNDKAKEMITISRSTHIQWTSNRSQFTIMISGLQENVNKTVEMMKKKEEEMKESCLVFEMNTVQLNDLLSNNAAFLKQVREQYPLLSDIDRAEKKLILYVIEKDKKEEVNQMIANHFNEIDVISMQIPQQLVPRFIGVKGKNISAFTKKHSIQVDLQDKTGELVLSGQKENMVNAQKEVEEWLRNHTLCSMEVDYEIAFPCLVGNKGSIRTQLEKEHSVEIHVEKEGSVWVVGEEEAAKKAIEVLKEMVNVFEREHKTITIREDILKNAPEFRQASFSKKMKEFSIDYQISMNKHLLYLHGKEEALKEAMRYIDSLVSQYQSYALQALDIPAGHIGSLVGKNGEHLQSLQQELKVMINTKEEQVSIWGEEGLLKKAEEAIMKDLKNRVIVTKQIECTSKQVQYLTADRNALRMAIEDETGARILIPREIPTSGLVKLTVNGNDEQVTMAVPIVREAILGMIRQRMEFTAEELKVLLQHSSIQLQRIQLESRCRIQCNQETGVVLVVGPKEGIQLIYKRFWTALSELFPMKYRMLLLEEVVVLALEDRAVEKEMKEKEEKEHCLLKRLDDCLIITSPEGSTVNEYIESLIHRVKENNHLFFVGKEMISYIIGAKGSRISQIKKASNTTLRVIRDEVVLIHGKPEDIAKATEALTAALEEYKATHVSIAVEEELVNTVRGVRNGNILSIQRQYNVRINVDRSGMITVNGQEKENVEKAREELNGLIAKARENPENSGVLRFSYRESPRRVEKKEREEEVDIAGLWERLKQAPLLPTLEKKTTVGGSANYQ